MNPIFFLQFVAELPATAHTHVGEILILHTIKVMYTT